LAKIVAKGWIGDKKIRKVKFWMTVFLGDFILKLKGIKIIEAKTEEEKRMVYRLRYDVYTKHGYINPQSFPNGELEDEDDEHSISYLALKVNKPIGTIRLILGDKKESFPTFRMWNVDLNKFSKDFSKIGDLSKLCILNKLCIINSKNKKFWI
jgi:hypothetical protein